MFLSCDTYKCECGCVSKPCVLSCLVIRTSVNVGAFPSLVCYPEVAQSLQCQGVTFFMHIPITGGTTSRNTNNLLLHP